MWVIKEGWEYCLPPLLDDIKLCTDAILICIKEVKWVFQTLDFFAVEEVQIKCNKLHKSALRRKTFVHGERYLPHQDM
jgi:hypothetical protein